MTDTCTPDQRAEIIAAAKHRAGFLLWLAECLSEPRWSRMDAVGQEVIRREAAAAMRQIAG